jgi:glucose/arabinose dehydrogenase
MITCNLGTMGVGRLAGAAVFIVVRPQATGVLRNTATVTADGAAPKTATVETPVEAALSSPVVEDPNLAVRTVVSGLAQPTGIAFLRRNDFLLLEKGTGKVKRVVNGVVQSTVLDLPVNSFSERGLLGIALHPDFEDNGFVYLYWTCRAASFRDDCAGGTEDTDVAAQVPLLGNRVDRFKWDGSKLTFDKNLIRLRAFQNDAGQPLRGNHNGGKIAFEARERKDRDRDRERKSGEERENEERKAKLFVYFGDNGRRGLMQNVQQGFGPATCEARPSGPRCDDQFGGPEPDDAHLTGVVLRLNDDGTTPEDNPFFEAGAAIGGEMGANIQKVFAYGIRNGFGIAVDPETGQLWESQNADDAGSEINRIEAGFNGGWVQVMGLLDRITDYKAIETSPQYFGLQQNRWPPTLIADTPGEALSRLFVLPGARYTDPLLTWKFEVAPAGLGFVVGDELGEEFEGDLIVGGARDFLLGGHLFRLKLSNDRLDLVFSDPQLRDRVADNLDKWDITESESLLFGRGFGITTDIQTGPNGHLFVSSLTNGAVYEILRKEDVEDE